jgi:hypothetical protein
VAASKELLKTFFVGRFARDWIPVNEILGKKLVYYIDVPSVQLRKDALQHGLVLLRGHFITSMHFLR